MSTRCELEALLSRRSGGHVGRGSGTGDAEGGDPVGAFSARGRVAPRMECLPRTAACANQDPEKSFQWGGVLQRQDACGERSTAPNRNMRSVRGPVVF